MTTLSPTRMETEASRWDCISTADEWEVHGGAWLQEVTPFAFKTIIVRSTATWEAAEKPWYGYVTYIDVMDMTWPEIKDALGWDVKKPKKISAQMAEQVNMNMLGKGWGKVVGSADGTSASEVREKCADLADEWQPAKGHQVKVLSMTMRKWQSHNKADPGEYMKGYKAGLSRKDAWEDMSEIAESGWRHGWEVAVRRVEPIQTQTSLIVEEA